MDTKGSDKPLMEDRNALLENAFIEEHLRSQGCSLEQLHMLPKKLRKKLMTAASNYASLKLEEIEARAHFIEEIHDTASSGE
jgi:hypothetical protein